MKALERNKQTFYYALHQSATGITDTDNLFTGQYSITYSNPVKAYMNISPARGQSILEQFGIQENYDKVVVTDDMSCPISEDDVLWIDTMPVIAGEPQKQGDPPAGSTETPHDYYVVRVARSLNNIAIAVKKA